MEKLLILLNKLLKIVICCFLLIQSENGLTQINFEFISHLSHSKLKKEHWTYIHQINSTSDSISYLEAKYHFQYDNDSMLLSSIEKCKSIALNDSNFIIMSSLKMLTVKNEFRDKWFNTLKNSDLSFDVKTIFNFYFQLENPINICIDSIPLTLKNDFQLYQKAFRKKPIIAFSLSIIPGLGELYIGNKKAFFAEALPISVLALQIIESVRNFGLLKPITALNTGFFSGYYFSSFIGSYRDTKAKKIDTKHQLLINASNYYASLYPVGLY